MRLAVSVLGTTREVTIALEGGTAFDNNSNYDGIEYAEGGLRLDLNYFQRLAGGFHVFTGNYTRDFNFPGSVPFRIVSIDAETEGVTDSNFFTENTGDSSDVFVRVARANTLGALDSCW